MWEIYKEALWWYYRPCGLTQVLPVLRMHVNYLTPTRTQPLTLSLLVLWSFQEARLHCCPVSSVWSVGSGTWLLVGHLWVLASVRYCIFMDFAVCDGSWHSPPIAVVLLLQLSSAGVTGICHHSKWHHFEMSYIFHPLYIGINEYDIVKIGIEGSLISTFLLFFFSVVF